MDYYHLRQRRLWQWHGSLFRRGQQFRMRIANGHDDYCRPDLHRYSGRPKLLVHHYPDNPEPYRKRRRRQCSGDGIAELLYVDGDEQCRLDHHNFGQQWQW